MIEVVIKGIVVTHQYGTLNTDDVLRTDPKFAKHLVDDCGAASYRTQADADAAAAAAEPDDQADATASAPAPARAVRGKK